ncbi:hypothetical protein J6590_012956 [Homalodisca vitripennis]|nr:hypothetical protein J6590_012954 [Homalodisca vitripennis]KAG8322963.1 hypothetical protein J6590_012956 [Homalodisca vitripennis]
MATSLPGMTEDRQRGNQLHSQQQHVASSISQQYTINQSTSAPTINLHITEDTSLSWCLCYVTFITRFFGPDRNATLPRVPLTTPICKRNPRRWSSRRRCQVIQTRHLGVRP